MLFHILNGYFHGLAHAGRDFAPDAQYRSWETEKCALWKISYLLTKTGN